MVLATGFTILAGTAAVADASSGKADCRDPYPCERYWPEGLNGPFALKEVRNVQVRSHDGTVLDGWIASPAVPAGVKTPVVLAVSPYLDYVDVVGPTWTGNPSDPEDPTCETPAHQGCGFWYDGTMGATARPHSLGVYPIHLIQEGYTLAYFSVRGTGSSGGCLEWGGRNEQLDEVALVNYLAKQAWSNGRVGMGGLSYLATTAWEAAVQAPPALKTIITAGATMDWFEYLYSPQGSWRSVQGTAASEQDVQLGLNGGVPSKRTSFLQHVNCPHTQQSQRETAALATGDRDALFWKERNLLPRLSSVRAAVLDTTGYLDMAGELFQSDATLGSLDRRTPKVQFRGWWAHEFPFEENSVRTRLDLPSGKVMWERVVVSWLDYWLKGVGHRPTDRVYHQDQELRWHEASAWAPRPAGKQVLYLTGGELTSGAKRGSTDFLSAPDPDASWGEAVLRYMYDKQLDLDGNGLEPSLCQAGAGVPLSRAYLTRPVSSRTLIAGNPFAYLRLASDQPGGVVSTTLFDLGPDFACTGPHYAGARWLASGSVDLSYSKDPFLAHDFPVNTPTQVRIDLSDLTYSLAPGHRLALVVNHGEAFEYGGTKTFPTITVLGDSHLVVPVAEGTLGGKRPTLRYPQRPFTPRGYRD
jgi:putative CocE/NonD family hydrolase